MTRAAGVIVVALAGCDGVLGLHAARSADASDGVLPGIDAPPPCSVPPVLDHAYVPATGGFDGGSIRHPSLYQSRVMFVENGHIVDANADGTGAAPITALDAPGGGVNDDVAVSPAGDEVWFVRLDGAEAFAGAVHATLANGSWSTHAMTIDLPGAFEPGTIARYRGTDRMVIAAQVNGDFHLFEGTTTDRASFTLTPITTIGAAAGVSDIDPYLSPDGCWLVFASDRNQISSNYNLYIAARFDADQMFHVVGEIATGVPQTAVSRFPTVGPDMTTLYFTVGNPSMLYVP